MIVSVGTAIDTKETTMNSDPTYEQAIIDDLTVIYNDCLTAADKATNSTYRFYWKAEAKKYADRIARRVEMLAEEVK
jgi:hypothetical protein